MACDQVRTRPLAGAEKFADVTLALSFRAPSPGGMIWLASWKLCRARPICLRLLEHLRPGGGLADLLDRGQQQADQDRDDRDHHQQFDQREGPTSTEPKHGGISERNCVETSALAPSSRNQKRHRLR